MSQKTQKNEQSVTTHFKAVFRGDLDSGGCYVHFDLDCDNELARGL